MCGRTGASMVAINTSGIYMDAIKTSAELLIVAPAKGASGLLNAARAALLDIREWRSGSPCYSQAVFGGRASARQIGRRFSRFQRPLPMPDNSHLRGRDEFATPRNRTKDRPGNWLAGGRAPPGRALVRRLHNRRGSSSYSF